MNNEIKAGSKILAEFDGYTEEVVINPGDWGNDYPNHKKIRLSDPTKGGRRWLEFEPKMQFTYHTDYNELIRVWRKFRDLDDLEYRFKPKYKFKKAWLKILIAENPIEDVFKELVEGVKYLNSIKPKS